MADACIVMGTLLGVFALSLVALGWARRACTVKCCAIGCENKVDRPRLFCEAHWTRLPDEQRLTLMEAWDIDSSGRVHKRAYDFFMATVRAVNVIAIMEGRISYEEAMHREEQSERAYERQHGADSV
jgi:hypothetical protein